MHIVVSKVKLLDVRTAVPGNRGEAFFYREEQSWYDSIVQKFEAKFKECDNLFCKLTVCK